MICILLILLATCQASSVELSSMLDKVTQFEQSHLCVASENIQDDTVKMFIAHIQNITFPKTIISVENSHFFKQVQRKCSLVVMVHSKLEADSLNRVLGPLSSGSGWNRTAWFLMIVCETESYDGFAQSVSTFGILNSLLFVNMNDEFKLVSFNYFTQSLHTVATEEDAICYLRSYKMKEISGYSVRIPFTRHMVYMVLGNEENENIFEKLLLEYIKSMNATLEWEIDVYELDFDPGFNDSFPHLALFNRMKKISVEFEYVLMPTIDGYCMVMYETPIGSYFQHLLIPFDTGVWIILSGTIFLLILVNRLFNHHLPQDIVIAYFFGLNIPEHQMKIVERFVLHAFTWLFFLAGEAYLAKMISFMNSIKQKPRLRDIVDFQQSEFGICDYFVDILIQFEDIYPEISQKIDPNI